MQLGTRWSAGAEQPASVPAVLRTQIAAVEAVLDAETSGAPRWTLTWLEGRPIAELDTGVIVTLDAAGAAVVVHDDEDDIAP